MFAPAAATQYSSTAQYARVLRSFNPGLSHAQSRLLADHVRTEALYYRLDARLLVALVAIESSWHPYATSPVGAGGLGQLMPGTAAGLRVNAYQPLSNLNGTAHYLRGLLDRFGSYSQATRYQFALAGYNAGPGAVERYGGIPPYAETQNYVRNVMGIWERLTLSLSSHIDDYAHADAPRVAQQTSPNRIVSAAFPSHHRPQHSKISKSRERHISSVPVMIADARPPQSLEKTASKRKPFLYYVFHHHHRDESPADAPNDMGPDPTTVANQVLASNAGREAASLGLVAPSSVPSGRPINLRITTPQASPITVIARIGDAVVSRTTIAAHAKKAVLKGIPGADAVRIVVLSAYVRGKADSHIAVAITSGRARDHTVAQNDSVAFAKGMLTGP
ncbi:MAG: hypothetical protein NVSMB31_15430 [Vulcanimicrobiaceae bacterium]